jgi:hypothetical protein
LRWETSIIFGAACGGYQLLLEGTDGRMYPITNGGNSVTLNTVTPATNLKIGGKILFYNTSTDRAENYQQSNYIYEGEYTDRMEYWSNKLSAWAVAGKPVYLVVEKTSNNTFKVLGAGTQGTSYVTQDLPTSDDGYLYIQIGFMHDTWDAFRLQVDHPIYHYKDGAVRLYTPTHHHDPADITNFEGAVQAVVPSWALQASKPSYNFSEIGAKPTTLSGYGITDAKTAAQITAEIQAAVDALVGGAPGALDTLNELAAALNDDAAFNATITNALALKAPLSNPAFTGVVTLAQMYINNVNTRLLEGSGNALRLQTNSGYIDVGAQNTSYAHIYTDRPEFYFNKEIKINGQNVVKTNDARLSDARPASDVSAWAKAASKPSYNAAEVGAMPTTHPANNHTATHLYMSNGDGFIWDDTANVMKVRKDGTDYILLDQGNAASLASAIGLALTTDLDNYVLGSYMSGHEASHAPANAQKNSDITKAEIEAKLTGTITTHAHNYMASFQLEDGDGTEVTINNGKEVKFVEGGGIDINWTDTTPGSDADPFDMTFKVVGVQNQESTSQYLKLWLGTQAQYDAIGTKDGSTLYFCT